eukprot:CAMPEP_0170738506 /NCGR_PEP_ID=MMETSP0437-20130122/4681_1 /TAXON_ID=0 /ORGANISM="Sexangularia sp." /LENGTH=955 /DNA_ID=CAMNT_0011076933 /DNA_START=7 /DNA_END=2874 /DNA_ORIENTATION=-
MSQDVRRRQGQPAETAEATTAIEEGGIKGNSPSGSPSRPSLAVFIISAMLFLYMIFSAASSPSPSKNRPKVSRPPATGATSVFFRQKEEAERDACAGLGAGECVETSNCGYCWGGEEGCWTGTKEGPSHGSCTGVRAWQWQELPSGRVAHANVSHDEWHAAGQQQQPVSEEDVDDDDEKDDKDESRAVVDGDVDESTVTVANGPLSTEVPDLVADATTTAAGPDSAADPTTTESYEEPLHWTRSTSSPATTTAVRTTVAPAAPAPPTPPPTRAHVVFRMSSSEFDIDALAETESDEETESEEVVVDSGVGGVATTTTATATDGAQVAAEPSSTVPPRPPCLHGMTEDECAFRVAHWEQQYGITTTAVTTSAAPATRHTVHFETEPTPAPPLGMMTTASPPSPAPTAAATTATTEVATTTTTVATHSTAPATPSPTAALPPPTPEPTAVAAPPSFSDDPLHIRVARNDSNLRAWMDFNVSSLVERAKSTLFRGTLGDGARTQEQVAEILEEIAQELRSARWAMRSAFFDAVSSARAASLAHALHMPPSLREDERRVGACARTVSQTMDNLMNANKVVAASRRDLEADHTPRQLGYVAPAKGTAVNLAGAWIGGGWRLASSGQALRLEGRNVLTCGGGRWIMFVGDSNMRALYDDTVSVVRNALAERKESEGWTHVAIAERTGAWGDRDALIGRRRVGGAGHDGGDTVTFRPDDEEALYLSFRFVGSVGAPVGSPDERKWRAILDHPRHLYTHVANLSSTWDFDAPRTLLEVESSAFARTRRPHEVFFSAGMWDLVLGTRATDVAAGGAAALGAFARSFSAERAHGASHLTFLTPSRTSEASLDAARADSLANHRLLHQLYSVWRPTLAKLPNVTVIDSWTFFPAYVVERPVLLGNATATQGATADQSLRSGSFLNAMLLDLNDLKEHDGYHDAPVMRGVLGGALFKQVCRRRKAGP